MSNSVVFLLIAVGLSALGTFAVWLQGRPRRSRSSVDVFNRSLRALATSETHLEPLSGVTVRPSDSSDGYDEYADDQYADAYNGDVNEYDGHDERHRSSSSVDSDVDAVPRSPRSGRRPNPRPNAPRRERTNGEGADPGA